MLDHNILAFPPKETLKLLIVPMGLGSIIGALLGSYLIVYVPSKAL